MADAMTFELVSPERKLASADAESVTIPGIAGDMTAMANHAPFLTTMRPGFVTVRNGGSEDQYFVTGGFAEISDNVISVLAEEAVEGSAVTAEYLDSHVAAAESALEEAGEDRKQAAQQRVNDFITLKSII
ncbi:MAG: ATP synthase F1 subunit epsilon [Pseudomonadota bacterium]